MKYALLATLAACGFPGLDPAAQIDAGLPPDIASDFDAGPDGPLCTLWDPHHFEPCELPPATGPLVIGGRAQYNTTTGVLTIEDNITAVANVLLEPAPGQSVRVMVVAGLLIEPAGVLRVVGQYPVIIASEEDIRIDGRLDAASREGGERGAGSLVVPCSNTLDGATHTSGTGGGAGGSFRGSGGNGSHGDENLAITGGTPNEPVTAPTFVRGGCDGGRGGHNTNTTSGHVEGHSTGGLGGGAVQLSARLAIVIRGAINAGGGGGGGAPLETASGGGGGGSGGFIGLDSTSIALADATLAANGGAGGGSAPFVGTGIPGGDALASSTAATNPEHLGGDCGVTGGAGAAGTVEGGSTPTESDECGGGGGGGGVGHVLWWTSAPTTMASTIISPALEPGPP